MHKLTINSKDNQLTNQDSNILSEINDIKQERTTDESFSRYSIHEEIDTDLTTQPNKKIIQINFSD